MVGNTYKIVNPETNEELPFGEEGEICVNGPTVMMGYLNNEEETKNVLKKHKDGITYLHTGDLGYIAANGLVYYTQRLKRMIVVSGFNVYPAMIEKVLTAHEAIKQCCVIGIPHQYKMHVPKAYLVLNEGFKESAKLRKELKELCKNELSIYSVPKEFEVRNEFPKTLYSKIDYKKLEEEEKHNRTQEN